MKVTGFSFIRNAVLYDYPIKEAILSVLPLCDQFVIAVGNCNDGTKSLIQSIDSDKIKIIETEWDDQLRTGGLVLAKETDKAYAAIDDNSDWCFYIQGDEIIHEKYYEEIKSAMRKWKDDKRVDGLLFNYLHFYGSYDYVGTSADWYKKEIRIIRKNESIYSYRDAQGFRKEINQKLNVKAINAYVYHYGWVKHPKDMQKKQLSFQKLWHDDHVVSKKIALADEFDYSLVNGIERFTGTHPKLMSERIRIKNWEFDRDISQSKISLKNRLKNILLKYFKWDLNYKNYKVI